MRSLLAVLGGGVVDSSTALIRADDPGVTRGDGCFEGIRVCTDESGRSRPDKLGRHLARMARSAAALDITFAESLWRELVAIGCAAWTEPAPGEAAMKLVLTRGPLGTGIPSGYLTITELDTDYPRQRREGIRVVSLERGVSSDAFTDAPWLLGGVKTLSYAVNMATAREAARRGAQDAIFVSTDGYVLEAPTGSVVWAKGRTLRTTAPGGTGILSGTTGQRLFEQAAAAGWTTEYALVPRAELDTADVIWIVSSVRGPVDVVDLDGTARERIPELDAEIKKLAGF